MLCLWTKTLRGPNCFKYGYLLLYQLALRETGCTNDLVDKRAPLAAKPRLMMLLLLSSPALESQPEYLITKKTMFLGRTKGQYAGAKPFCPSSPQKRDLSPTVTVQLEGIGHLDPNGDAAPSPPSSQ